MTRMVRTIPVVLALLVGAISMIPPEAVGQGAAVGWGTIKGRVILDPKIAKIPKNEPANVNQDKAHCLKDGPIPKNALVVNPKNRGVKYALVFIGDPKDPDNIAFTPPIHPKLEKFAPAVEIDQPCCAFLPRITVLRHGQELVVKNSGKVSHNFSISSIGAGPVQNILLAAGDKKTVKGFVPTKIPTQYGCNIHAWMKGFVAVVPHPYFAVTDEDGNFEIKNVPAGTFRLQVWHEEVGWVAMTGKKRGKSVTVKSGETTDAKTFEVDP